MRKYYNLKTIKAGNQYRIECASQDTNYGFRHVAHLYRGYQEIGYTKACYYNRTWEAYDYQSVIHNVIDKSNVEDPEALKKLIDLEQQEKIHDEFKSLGAIMALGGIMNDKPEEDADFKLRMLKARFGDAINTPADWDQLPTNEKLIRLEKIQQLFTAGV